MTNHHKHKLKKKIQKVLTLAIALAAYDLLFGRSPPSMRYLLLYSEIITELRQTK